MTARARRSTHLSTCQASSRSHPSALGADVPEVAAGIAGTAFRGGGGERGALRPVGRFTLRRRPAPHPGLS